MRRLTLALPLLLFAHAASAQGIDVLRADLSFSALSGEGDGIVGTSLTVDGQWNFDRNGLQISADVEGLAFGDNLIDDLGASALRAILYRDVSPRVRLGFSAGWSAGDEPTADHLSLGLHGLYTRPGFRLGGDFVKGVEDEPTNGAIVATLWAEQDLRPDLRLRGEMFRRSTDSEEDDRAAVSIGLTHDVNDSIYTFANLFRSSADDFAFYNDGIEIGGGWHWAEGREAYAAFTGKQGSGIDAIGITVGVRLSLGDSDRLFQASPLPDLVGYGTY